MKKYIFYLAALLLISLHACKKDKLRPQSNSHKYNPSTNMSKITSTYFPANETSLDTIVTSANDTDTYIRRVKLHLSVGLAEICKDSFIANWIYNQAHAAESNEVTFADLFDEFPETKDIIEEAVDPLNVLTGATFDEMEDALVYKGFSYRPSIFLTNDVSADGEYKPVICSGLEFMDDPENEKTDITLSWKIDASNEVSAVNVWESLAMSTNAPVLAVSLQGKDALPEPGQPEMDEPDAVYPDIINDRMMITKLKIYKQNDQSKWSEINIISKTLSTPFWGTSIFHNIYSNLRDNCGGGSYLDRRLKDLYKTDLGVEQNIGSKNFFCRVRTADEFPYTKHVYYNTWEYDWFAGKQLLGKCQWWGGPVLTLEGRMEYKHEYYMHNPYNNFFNTRLDIHGIYINAYTPYSNRMYDEIAHEQNYLRFHSIWPCQ